MINVLSAGFFTTVQDLGRMGFKDIGVPVSGAMDLFSATLANRILNNNDNDAVLEITFGGCKLQFLAPTVICISGADTSAVLNTNKIALHTAIQVQTDDVLEFGKPAYGIRSYLAVKGGFQTEVVLKSRSFYKEITASYLLQKGDMLPVAAMAIKESISFSSVKVTEEHLSAKYLEAYPGPEYEWLSQKQQEKLHRLQFTISNDNNRMGYRLKEPIDNTLATMLTSAVLPGTVQLTPSGTLIVLMRDCQVTGGYPRILQLTDDAIDKLAQKTTHHTFQFKILSLVHD